MFLKIIVSIILFIALVSAMYGTFEGIINKDDKLIIICSYGSVGIAILLGFIVSSICFSY